MTDITLCDGKDCPLKDSCYRYLAKRDPWIQSFFLAAPYEEDTHKCKYFWDKKCKSKTVPRMK